MWSPGLRQGGSRQHRVTCDHQLRPSLQHQGAERCRQPRSGGYISTAPTCTCNRLNQRNGARSSCPYTYEYEYMRLLLCVLFFRRWRGRHLTLLTSATRPFPGGSSSSPSSPRCSCSSSSASFSGRSVAALPVPHACNTVIHFHMSTSSAVRVRVFACSAASSSVDVSTTSNSTKAKYRRRNTMKRMTTINRSPRTCTYVNSCSNFCNWQSSRIDSPWTCHIHTCRMGFKCWA